MSEQVNNLVTAVRFFVQISIELVVLFIGITFLVSLILQYVSPERVQKALAGRRLGLGNIIGAAFGGVTPFCSCSAVPMLMGLLELGIPFGVAMSFLIASPLGVFNPVVLSLFGTLLGPRVLVLYIVTTFTAAVLAGIILDALGLGSYVKKVRIIGTLHNSEKGGFVTFKERVKTAAQSAVGLFRQMVPYMLVGVAIGAFIYGFVPASFLARIAGPGNPFAIPVAAAIGVPLYVRTETLIPVGFAMIQKGVSVGAIMALTIGGAGASIPELSMLAGVFKRRLWLAYIITMLAIATIIGYLFNFLVSIKV